MPVTHIVRIFCLRACRLHQRGPIFSRFLLGSLASPVFRGCGQISSSSPLVAMSQPSPARADASDGWTWEEHFDALVRYTDGPGGGDPNRPRGHVLSSWLATQRQLRRRARNPLDPARGERLERLGVRWDIRARGTDAWDEYFGALKRYKEGPGNGDPNCVNAYVDPETGLKLGVWLNTQRELKRGLGFRV